MLLLLFFFCLHFRGYFYSHSLSFSVHTLTLVLLLFTRWETFLLLFYIIFKPYICQHVIHFNLLFPFYWLFLLSTISFCFLLSLSFCNGSIISGGSGGILCICSIISFLFYFFHLFIDLFVWTSGVSFYNSIESSCSELLFGFLIFVYPEVPPLGRRI